MMALPSTVRGSENPDEVVRALISGGRYSLIAVLVFLCKAGKATLSDVQRALTGGRYRAQYNWTLSILSELIRMGLVYEERIQLKDKFKVRLFDLTDMGREVSKKLCKILGLE